MARATLHFPPDFLWGTATSSHQVEGNNTNNDWWAWEHSPQNRVFESQTSGDACDWWEGRAEEDIARMAELGLRAHRMSVEWSRIEPEPGTWDYAAIDRYREILTAMKDVGIRPMLTLHHFTNPQWLAERGGWLNEETPAQFANYANKVVTELLDLCNFWCTINEPNVLAFGAYLSGRWPPQHESARDYIAIVANLLRGHGLAYRKIKQVQRTSEVGLAKHIVSWHPAGDLPHNYVLTWYIERAFNRITIDALKSGVLRVPFRSRVDVPEAKDSLDWIGLNYYHRLDVGLALLSKDPRYIRLGARPGVPQGPDEWGEFYAQGLFDALDYLHNTLGLPIYVTENGLPDGEDTERPGFMLRHLQALWQATMSHKGVQGYFWWSLVDNFEWAEGYDPRFNFGLYQVDFETQERALRPSGELFSAVVKANAIDSEIARPFAPDAVEELFPGRAPVAEVESEPGDE